VIYGIQHVTPIEVDGRTYFVKVGAPAYEGGMSFLYEATDEAQRVWLIRVPKGAMYLPPKALDQVARQFEREGEILKSLGHAGIVWCEAFERRGDEQYMVLERLIGSFEGRVGDVWPDEAVDIGVQVAAALDHLASQPVRVIHRDIKPANLLYDQHGRVRLCDFGIARLHREAEPDGQDTFSFFSAGYAPPEQAWRYGQTDADSDVYALGLTLHALLAGRPGSTVAPERGAWRDRTAADLLAEIPNPDKRREAGGLAEVLARAIRYDRTERYQTAAALGQALAKVAHDRSWAPSPSFRTCPYCGHRAVYEANFCGACRGKLNRGAPDPYTRIARRGLLF
jgi:serine/threonine protein kinase